MRLGPRAKDQTHLARRGNKTAPPAFYGCIDRSMSSWVDRMPCALTRPRGSCDSAAGHDRVLHSGLERICPYTPVIRRSDPHGPAHDQNPFVPFHFRNRPEFRQPLTLSTCSKQDKDLSVLDVRLWFAINPRICENRAASGMSVLSRK